MSGTNVVRVTKIKLSLVLVICLMLAWFGTRQINVMMEPVDPADKKIVEIDIPNSSSTHRIADILAEHKLIRNRSFFIGYCRAKNYDSQLKAGIYQFSRSQSLQEILDDLIAGRVATLQITVPEGYTLKQIGETLVRNGICTKEQWQEALTGDYDFKAIKDIPRRDNRLEGFLYPDTYKLRKGITADQVIELMLKRFETVWNDGFAQTASSKGLTTYRVITMASMIEKEALFNKERPRIAGVLYNRLAVGMPLQVDATVLYSLGKHKERVTYADLKVDSPYNTYLYDGMPPGPIASPGAASIEAALNPEKNDYYYYVAMDNGLHYFSRTYQEHLQAKSRYIK